MTAEVSANPEDLAVLGQERCAICLKVNMAPPGSSSREEPPAERDVVLLWWAGFL